MMAFRKFLIPSRDLDALRVTEDDFRSGTDCAPIEISCTFCNTTDAIQQIRTRLTVRNVWSISAWQHRMAHSAGQALHRTSARPSNCGPQRGHPQSGSPDYPISDNRLPPALTYIAPNSWFNSGGLRCRGTPGTRTGCINRYGFKGEAYG